jgi:murein DD-endopeptidase MepM/ murein hydrolase activator NlpD
MFKVVFLLLQFLLISALGAESKYKPLVLKLPTINTGLIDGSPETFYMYVDRLDANGNNLRPWTGGTYGYCRTLVDTPEGKIAIKFHEGIDIAPLKRDKNQEPLDMVHSIADGEVVYALDNAGGSNYGKYIVVKHDWGYGPFYSLYAHMGTVDCKVGQAVKAETPLGRLGYTGKGINRERAHLHLELAIMIQPAFDNWHKLNHPDRTISHGPYNGQNLRGIDLGALFLELHKNPQLDIPTFLKDTPIHFKVVIPRSGSLSICENYPWIKRGDHESESPSWEISFTTDAFPLEVAPSSLKVKAPALSWIKPLNFDQSYRTQKLITGIKSPQISSEGINHLQILSGDFPRKSR